MTIHTIASIAVGLWAALACLGAAGGNWPMVAFSGIMVVVFTLVQINCHRIARRPR